MSLGLNGLLSVKSIATKIKNVESIHVYICLFGDFRPMFYSYGDITVTCDWLQI